MKPRGIRFKLTIWYALAFSVAGSIIFLSFYLLTRQALYYQTDISLSTHGLKVMEVALRQDTGMHDGLAKQAFLDEFAKIPGMLVIIADKGGKVLSSSLSYGENNQAIDSLSKEAALYKESTFQNKEVGTTNLRFWVNPIIKEGQTMGVILVAHPIDVIENSLSALVSAMSIVYVSLVMLTTFGGFLLAKKATKPISEITQKIRRITAENLNERVGVTKTDDEIEELSETFNGLMDRLDSAFKRERQFIGDVAHELKTPLTTLTGEIELALSKKRKSEDYRQTLKEALIDARRLSTTLRDLLDLAWTQTDAKHEKVALSMLVADIAKVAKKLALAKRIRIRGKIEGKLFVLGRKDKLSRAILNLVENAIKFSPEKGLVEIGAKKEGDFTVIEIADNGGGISKADKPHIFERFFRGNRTGTAGSGLGLPIAQAIIEAHRGKIKIESAKDRGTTAKVYLPSLL